MKIIKNISLFIINIYTFIIIFLNNNKLLILYLKIKIIYKIKIFKINQ